MDKKRDSMDALDKNIRQKGVVIPIIFAIIVAVITMIVFSPSVGLFPNGNHQDSLTTTAPTETSEYIENEFVQSK